MISGTLIYGNIFRRCAAGRLGFGGVQIHGGKENVVDNNLFVDCATARSFSPWGRPGLARAHGQRARRGAIDRTLYLSRYPDLARLNENLNANHLWRNLVVNCGEFLRRNRGGARLLGNCVATNRTAFPDTARGVFQFGDAASLLERASFQPLPFNEIGLYRDAPRGNCPRNVSPNCGLDAEAPPSRCSNSAQSNEGFRLNSWKAKTLGAHQSERHGVRPSPSGSRPNGRIRRPMTHDSPPSALRAV